MVDSSSQPPRAGGFLLAAAILVGTTAGSVLGQPSIGFLTGLAIGLLALAGTWLADRRRQGDRPHNRDI